MVCQEKLYLGGVPNKVFPEVFKGLHFKRDKYHMVAEWLILEKCGKMLFLSPTSMPLMVSYTNKTGVDVYG